MDIKEILLNFLIQVCGTVGVIILFGFLIAACNRAFYSNFGSGARAVCYFTGFFGTPVHELSHAIFCLLFGHKIVEMKLFQVSNDGNLGYVNHSYNPKNLYHRLGNFFIGVAPILVISGLLYALSLWLLPSFSDTVSDFAADIDVGDVGGIFLGLLSVIGSFFSSVVSWQWWAFIGISFFFALHMTLSKADMKGAASGIIFLLLGFLIVDFVLSFIGGSLLDGFSSFIMTLSAFLTSFLLMALCVSLVSLMFSFIIRLIRGRR